MDLLNISYTKESSVLTKGETSFICTRIRIWPILGYVLLFQEAHDFTSWPCA